VRDREAAVENAYPRCVTREGNRRAQELLWRVFETAAGRWRGIAEIPDGNLRLRAEWAALDARRRFEIDLTRLMDGTPPELARECICGDIMTGTAAPTDCRLYGKECRPETPVGACMVSSEGTCKIWHLYGGRPDVALAAETGTATAKGTEVTS
jgi:hydrogenase expression/formation protein HypD